MDVFRFAKLTPRANDPTRRYRLMREAEGDQVGSLDVTGGPGADRVTATLTCSAALSDAAREDALATARRFLDELVGGWGLLVGTAPAGSGWADLPDGGHQIRLEYGAG
jgi:hypothetical protein